MTLQQAAERFSVSGLNLANLQNQDEAFENCLSFLKGIKKIRRQNCKRATYSYKHMVENPSGEWGVSNSNDHYTGYVYEGTFILAALAAGFTRKQRGSGLRSTFNISEPGLRRRALEITGHSTRSASSWPT